MRKKQNHNAIDRIADTSAELARIAADIGLDSLAYILRMAELEALTSIGSGQPPRKPNGRIAYDA